MDNLTHSLTGALAAKIIDHSRSSPEASANLRRKIFWLMVLCANLPDIDVIAGFLGDRMFSMQHHRGLTHSLLFAPVFAALPATAFHFIFKLKNFKALWLCSLIGILVHICFDVITPFGTQILAPLSTTRYALDWMFIVDPFFTGILALTMFLQRIATNRSRFIIFAGSALVVAYLAAEIINHHLAYRQVQRALQQQGIEPAPISALPQPLSIFRWKGLAQTDERVLQTFFSIPAREDTLTFENYENAHDDFVGKALRTEEAQWYMRFARHPWIQSSQRGTFQIVEFRDLQFTIDKAILRAVGFPERSTPFVMRFTFLPDGSVREIALDGRAIAH